MERSPEMPSVTKVPTIIVGMDVSHGSPGLSDIPSVAAVTLFSFLIISYYVFHVNIYGGNVCLLRDHV